MRDLVDSNARRDVLRLISYSGVCALAGAYSNLQAAVPQQKEWFDKLDRLRGFPGQPFRFSIRITSRVSERQIEENFVDVFFRSHKQVLVLFRSPQTVSGRRILVDGNDMWLALPTSNRVLRISPSQRLLGEASNGDVMNTNFAEYTLVEQGEVDFEGAHCIRLKLAATTTSQNYQTIEYLVDPETQKPTLSYHFAASGKLIKSIRYQTYKIYDGRELVHTLQLINPITKTKDTLMTFEDYQLKKLPEEYFKKDVLLDLAL
jgi:outer membrane lipoprotein-sorting protein